MQANIKQAVRSYFRGASPGVLLDIPCGSGWLREELTQPGWEYHGADVSGNSNLARFKRVDLNGLLPYADDLFDHVACLEGLEHIENYHHVLRECTRILKRGGRLLISTPNPLCIKSRIRFFWYGTFWGFPHLVTLPPEGSHLHMTPINLSFLISCAEKYGLKLNVIHRVRPKGKRYAYLVHACLIKLSVFIKTLVKKGNEKEFIRRLCDFNVLLNDGIVISFIKI